MYILKPFKNLKNLKKNLIKDFLKLTLFADEHLFLFFLLYPITAIQNKNSQ